LPTVAVVDVIVEEMDVTVTLVTVVALVAVTLEVVREDVVDTHTPHVAGHSAATFLIEHRCSLSAHSRTSLTPLQASCVIVVDVAVVTEGVVVVRVYVVSVAVVVVRLDVVVVVSVVTVAVVDVDVIVVVVVDETEVDVCDVVVPVPVVVVVDAVVVDSVVLDVVDVVVDEVVVEVDGHVSHVTGHTLRSVSVAHATPLHSTGSATPKQRDGVAVVDVVVLTVEVLSVIVVPVVVLDVHSPHVAGQFLRTSAMLHR